MQFVPCFGHARKKEILISHMEKKNVDSEIVQTLEKAALKGCVATWLYKGTERSGSLDFPRLLEPSRVIFLKMFQSLVLFQIQTDMALS